MHANSRQPTVANIAELLNSKHLSDVTFVVEGERFYAHKDILCASCKYFNNLLSGSWSDFNGLELEIEIRDYSPKIFFRILQFIYTGSVGNLKDFEDQMVLSLLDAAIFYELDKMQQTVEEHIVNNLISIHNVCTLWRIAMETGAKVLSNRCVEFFRLHSSEITQQADFLEQMWGIPEMHSSPPINTLSISQGPPQSFDFPFTLEEGKDDQFIQAFLQDTLLASDSIDPISPQQTTQAQHYPYPVQQIKTETKQEQQQLPKQQTTPYQQQQYQPIQQQYGYSFPPKQEPKQDARSKSHSPQQQQQWTPQYVQPTPQTQTRIIDATPQMMQQQQQSPQPSNDSMKQPAPPPPNYKTLSTKQLKRLPMLQGPIWAKALEKMNLLIDLIRDLISADIGTLFLHDPISNELYSHVTHPEPVDIAIPAHLGIAGAAFTTGRSINSPSAYTDPRFYSGIDRQTGAPTLAILAVPIISSETGRPLGIVELLNKKRTTSFTAENEKEVTLIARMLAKIVEKATLEVKQDIEKKGMKRMQTQNTTEEAPQIKKQRSRRRNSIPVLHFKQMKQPSDMKQQQDQKQQQQIPAHFEPPFK